MSGREPLRIVIFTGGAVLEDDCVRLIQLIEEEPSLYLAGVFCQAGAVGLLGTAADLVRRRGWLAPALLLQRGLRFLARALLSPRQESARVRALRTIRPRLHFVQDLHAQAVLGLVESLKPDVGAAYGGPILRPVLFELPSHGTLGIHHGLLPWYRGKKTTFWALYNGETEVGVAIQRIGTRLDGGAVLRQATLPAGRKPLPVIRRQLEQIGLELYREALLAVQRGEDRAQPQPQDGGPLYRDPDAVEIVRFWLRDVRRILGRSQPRPPRGAAP